MRPLLYFALIVLLLVSIVQLPSCNSSTANESSFLKFNLQKGKAYNYTMKVDMENAVGEKKMTSDMNFDYDIEVTDDKDGIKTLKSTYKRVVMKMEGGSFTVDIDTDKPSADTVIDPQANPMGTMANMFHAIVGKNFIMKVDPEGKVTDVSGLKEMAESMLASMDLNDEMRPTMERLFTSQFNEQNLKQSFSQAFNIFPNKAVKVGDSWEKVINMPGVFSGTVKTIYKVKDIAKDNVTLDVNSVMEMGSNKGTQAGTMVVDAKTGLVTSGDLEQKFGGNMNSSSRISIRGKEK